MPDPVKHPPSDILPQRPPTRLLVVDDDPIQREFALLHLQAPDLEIETASDGVAGLMKLEREAFDLAIFDLDMPRKTGLELLRDVRAVPRLAHLPVLIVTARSDLHAIEQAYALGASAFTTKPLNWALLRKEMDFVLRAARLEEQARAAAAAAQNGAAAKSWVIKVLRHEIRTPIQAVLGFAELIAAGDRTQPKERERAGQIIESARKLDATLNNLLLYAQLASGEIAPSDARYDPLDLLESVRGLHFERATILPQCGRVSLICDRDLLVRALKHLFDNALALGPGAGPIRLVAARTSNGGLAFAVDDRGPGLTREQIERAMFPFQQASDQLARTKEGLGLGLPIAREIARLHCGGLSLETKSRGGLMAVLTLPAHRIAAEPALPVR